MVSKPVAERLPIFRHRHVGILVELHRVGREDVAGSRLIAHGQSLLRVQTCYVPVEILTKQVVLRAVPIREELASLFATVYHPSEQCRQPCCQVVVTALPELLRHETSPRL